jgi:hypothetical protein
VVINGEMHAQVMGGLAGFVRLEILVDQADAEQAIALLRDIREGTHAVAEDDELPGEDLAPGDEPRDRDERADAAGVWVAERPPRAVASLPGPTTGIDSRRRRTGIVLLLSVMAGFGTAHMATGAWIRGVALAALTIYSICYAVSGHASEAGWLLFGARAGDLVGALWRVWFRRA